MTEINLTNYEEHFISYLENELSGQDRLVVEQFIAAHPTLKAELELFESTVFVADTAVVFPNKNQLIRKEKKTISLRFVKISAAAAFVGLILGSCYFYQLNTAVTPITAAIDTTPFIDFSSTNNKKITIKKIKESSVNKPIEIEKIAKSTIIKSSAINLKKTKSITLLAYQTMLVPSASTSSTVEIKSKKLPLFTSIKNQLSATMETEATPIITQEVVASAPIKIGKQGREIIKLLGWAGNQLWGDEAYNPDIHIQTGFFEYQRTSANNKN
jgi:hypothetical protein